MAIRIETYTGVKMTQVGFVEFWEFAWRERHNITENFVFADIGPANLGPDQPLPTMPDKEWPERP